MNDLSPTFCVLPWYSLELSKNQFTPCCLLPTEFDLPALRENLLSGHQSHECQKCWKLEEQGMRSRRQQENVFLDYKLDRDIISIEQDVRQGRYEPLMYQIMLGNLCNQACVTCNGNLSTRWVELEKRLGILRDQSYQINVGDLDINWAKACRISLLGGEPLFDPNTLKILSTLLEHGNHECFISFVTNGSVTLDDRWIKVMKKFKDINICISIDGIESRFEYLRWPGKWQKLLSNLDQYRTITDNLSVSYTISSVNAIYYNETVDWFESQGLKYNQNMVYFPAWANLSQAPESIKKSLRGHDFLNGYSEITGQEIGIETFTGELLKQDQLKNISYRESLPELARLIDDSF
jgi:sulfatase maturation enzyme AslB (radical SAM superfamily)